MLLPAPSKRSLASLLSHYLPSHSSSISFVQACVADLGLLFGSWQFCTSSQQGLHDHKIPAAAAAAATV